MISTRLKPALRRPLFNPGAGVWILDGCGFALQEQAEMEVVVVWFFIGLTGGRELLHNYYTRYQIQVVFVKIIISDILNRLLTPNRLNLSLLGFVRGLLAFY